MAAKPAPVLIPHKIHGLLKIKGNFRRHAFEKLEEIAQECPWKLAFEEVVEDITRLWGIEAPYKNMLKSSFFEGLPDEVKEAIKVYTLAKNWCQSEGHTFFSQNDLEGYFRTLQKNSKLMSRQNDLPKDFQIQTPIENTIR